MRGLKRKMAAVLVLAVMCSCTGCAGMPWDEMRAEGHKLLEQGDELNRQLASEAMEVNSDIVRNDLKFEGGWKSIFEKKNLRIQYAPSDDLEQKSTVGDVDEFIKKLSLEKWELTEDFPKGMQSERVFFIQQPVSDKKQDGKYKNIANMRYFPAENCVVVTIGKGLIDLSNEFELSDDEFSSIYYIPEELKEYLEEF